ncbi:hypothetical protein ILUMI_14488, partial [Ignelater luminosus]
MKHCGFSIFFVILIGNVVCAPQGFNLNLSHQAVINTQCIGDFDPIRRTCPEEISHDIINVPCNDGFRLIGGICRELFIEEEA